MLASAPEAVLAIHDFYYGSRPGSWEEMRWRLQFLSERHLGSNLRAAAKEEDAKVANAKGALGGNGRGPR